MSPQKYAALEDEVSKVLKNSIIKESRYPKWVSNIVLVPKPSRKMRNARVTYQRLVNKMFARLLGTTIEVYVDDMLVKSQRGIEANPDKIRALLGMSPHRTPNEMQSLTGRVAALIVSVHFCFVFF
ncbi:Ribonuclease H [Abeliophyllum distichum]|uniref:Ribonuclease H n=1 Tax=Abeliophyllum distichum TaxID=126358 RepID=A0ABD1V4R4_9LAMI